MRVKVENPNNTKGIDYKGVKCIDISESGLAVTLRFFDKKPIEVEWKKVIFIQEEKETPADQS